MEEVQKTGRLTSFIVQKRSTKDTKIGKIYYKFAHIEWNQNYKILRQILVNLSKKMIRTKKFLGVCLNNIYSIGKRKGRKTQTKNFENYLEKCDDEEFKKLAEDVIPFIAGRALCAETEFGKNQLEILMTGESKILTLTRYQASILLSLMFFGLTPKQDSKKLPRDNDLSLIMYESFKDNDIKLEKLKFIFSYFEQISKIEISSLKNENISVERKIVDEKQLGFKFWKGSTKKLSKDDVGLIDSLRFGIEDSLQSVKIDFANHYLGGGVLSKGAVQEEILFLIFPENLIWMLMVEKIDLNESMCMTGSTRFCNYGGYSYDLQFKGEYKGEEEIKKDSFNRFKVRIEAIDALYFSKTDVNKQFRADKIVRELTKAYVGFKKQE